MKKEIYDSFLEKWNSCGMIQHKKITTLRKKAINKVIKNADYPLAEVWKAFENYAKVLKDSNYFWNYRWTMEDFLNRGLHRFVDEAEPLSNFKIKETKVDMPKFTPFDCGGSAY